jgi:hypothetical protein
VPASGQRGSPENQQIGGAMRFPDTPPGACVPMGKAPHALKDRLASPVAAASSLRVRRDGTPAGGTDATVVSRAGGGAPAEGGESGIPGELRRCMQLKNAPAVPRRQSKSALVVTGA